MSVEFTFVPKSSELTGNSGAAGPARVSVALRSARDVGFDNLLIERQRDATSDLDLAAVLAPLAERTRIVLSHVADALPPVEAAERLATIAASSPGRFAIRVGASARKLENETHEDAQERLDEYLTLLKRLWLNDRPFDHEGSHYSVGQGFVPLKPPQGHIQIRMGGLTGTALKVSARHADVFELCCSSPAEARALMDRVRNVATTFGRARLIRFALAVSWPGTAGPSPCAVALADRRPDDLVRQLLGFVEAGVDEFMIEVPDGADVNALRRTIALVSRLARRLRSAGDTASRAGPTALHPA